MIVKPTIGFVRNDTDALFLIHAQTILAAMTGNPNYPTPTPTLAAVTTGVNEYAAALSAAAAGGRELTAIKNAKRAILAALLRELASYVAVACKGSMPTLLSSGFPTQKPMPTPTGVLPAPTTPVLSLGARTGELNADTTPQVNSYIYNWRIALASKPDDYIQRTQTTAASKVFGGLTPGQIYTVEVNVMGSAGPSDWSDAATLMVV